VLENPEIKGKLEGAGNTVRIESPEQFKQTVHANRVKWADVAGVVEVVLRHCVRVLGGERAEGLVGVGRADIQLGGVAGRVARIDVGERTDIHVQRTGLELVAAVEVGLDAVAREPVDAGVPVADIEAAVAEGVVEAALHRRLEALGLGAVDDAATALAEHVLVLPAELVVGGERHVAHELRAGEHRQGGEGGENEHRQCDAKKGVHGWKLDEDR
jgi:hypothetical protein